MLHPKGGKVDPAKHEIIPRLAQSNSLLQVACFEGFYLSPLVQVNNLYSCSKDVAYNAFIMYLF